ncbi:MAG: hypothetical protein KAU48_08705 [Candidatus Thorarchaeota archaeon]|nr:hypothetical protein [Candidatus Thorarchaeota archaeon]
MAEIETPKVPPPPKGGPRDDSAGTLLKLVGGGCIAFFTCIFGLVFLLMGLSLGTVMPIMHAGIFILIALVCICIGCFSVKFTWDGIKKASG